jgi:hypothetical protein
MIQAKVDGLFKELEDLSIEIAEKELEKQNTTSITKMANESFDRKTQLKYMVLTMQFQLLSSIGGEKK